MVVVAHVDDLPDQEVYLDLRNSLGLNLYLKCEGFNFAGSLKLRAAAHMVSAAEREGIISSGSTLVESSSGNLGVALSVVAAMKSMSFICVTDPKCNPAAMKLIRVFGGEVIVERDADENDSHLAARKARVRQLCAERPGHVWLNQYENAANWLAHYDITAPSVAKQFPDLDVLFIGAGTGGTLTGCARYLRDHRPDVRIVAVDSVGSVNFGNQSGPRHIPGLGASEPMPLLDRDLVDHVVRVHETDAIRMCRRLARKGMLLGGSTGTVVHGAAQWLGQHDQAQQLTAAAIAPDLGERYIDTIYDDTWVRERYGDLTFLARSTTYPWNE